MLTFQHRAHRAAGFSFKNNSAILQLTAPNFLISMPLFSNIIYIFGYLANFDISIFGPATEGFFSSRVNNGKFNSTQVTRSAKTSRKSNELVNMKWPLKTRRKVFENQKKSSKVFLKFNFPFN